MLKWNGLHQHGFKNIEMGTRTEFLCLCDMLLKITNCCWKFRANLVISNAEVIQCYEQIVRVATNIKSKVVRKKLKFKTKKKFLIFFYRNYMFIFFLYIIYKSIFFYGRYVNFKKVNKVQMCPALKKSIKGTASDQVWIRYLCVCIY